MVRSARRGGARDPRRLLQAIRRAAVQAGRTGPRPFRAVARAGAAQLAASTPAATFGGTITNDGSKLVGSFTITDSNGQAVWNGRFEGRQGNIPALYGQAFTQALKAFCAPSRIQVDASIGFDSTDTQGSEKYRGTGVIAARIIGRERTRPDGTVARGDFEYAELTTWEGRDGTAVTLAGPCQIQPTAAFEGLFGTDLYKPPLALAVYRPDNTFLVFLPASATVGFNKLRPPDSCGGSGAVRAFFLKDGVQPHQIVVPKLGQTAELTGQATVGGNTTTTWSTSVTITRLPSIPPP